MARGGWKQRQRKLGKAGKRSRSRVPDQKPLKKDPGVLNVAPFKTQAQRTALQRSQRMEERKAARDRVMADRRSMESLQLDAQKRQQIFEQKEIVPEDLRTNQNLETENSRKAYYREFKKVVEASDVVLEVLDCRDPLGCRSPEMEKEVVGASTNKRLILVLNKIDLVAKDVVQKWLKYLRNELPTVAFKASTQQQNRNLHRSRVAVDRAGEDLLKGGGSVGADNLLRLLGSYCRNQGLRTAITVGVVGFPNVGKSSLINSLKRGRACSVGATPGVTKCLQPVHLDKHVKLLDCPGLVPAGSALSDTAIILRNCVKIERLADPVEPVAAILRRCDKEQVRQHYGVGEFADARQFLALLARRLGRLKKGGVPDHEQAARTVLTDWTRGRINYFTHPPETHTLPTHISAEIVTEMGAAFDVQGLEEGNMRVLTEIQSNVDSGEIVMETGLDKESPLREQVTVVLGPPGKGKGPGRGGPEGPPGGGRGGAGRGPCLASVADVDPLMQGQALREAGKRRRRVQKRADKLATKLSDSLNTAMDLTLED